jgi:D-cysteine desulfhydrase
MVVCSKNALMLPSSPIQDLGPFQGNRLFVKREDLLPFSFGGNKARKAELFFREVEAGAHDCVVTYGSGSSNHCRVVANHCARMKIPCFVIAPLEASSPTFNSQLIHLFGARVVTVPVKEVHDTIENTLADLRKSGKTPYFIPGGGHGDLGTEAYARCYREIAGQERDLGVCFDYIFLASGTGTTQAGLVCGLLHANDSRRIVGISIARRNPYGRDVVLDSIRSYLGDKIPEATIREATVFLDDFIAGGYGQNAGELASTVETVLCSFGIPLDTTYTAKAFRGMETFLCENGVSGRNILFLHTGGTPLFFDALSLLQKGVPS